MDLEYWFFKCPACGNSINEIKGTNILQCDCGMVFQPMISGKYLKVDQEEKRNEIKKILENTLVAYHTKKNEEFNRIRDLRKERAVNYLLNEIMKGPIIGGTIASPNSVTDDFGSFIWIALQKAIVVRDPICMICHEKPTKEVHHIRPRYLNGKNHPRNLIGLCLDCHDEIHRQIENGIQGVLNNSFEIQAPKFKTLSEFEDKSIDFY